MALLFPAGYQFFNSNGSPVSSGSIRFYETGTTTDKAIYSDVDMTVTASNPWSLDASGRLSQNIYGEGRYTVVVRLSTDVSVFVRDDYYGWPEANPDFIQAGTGAVTRTYQDKMRETVSVKDFGAVGNGLADDTAAIQAAIDAVEAAGGGVVYGSGVMRITSGLTITENNTVFDLNGGELFADFDSGWALSIGTGSAIRRRLGVRNGRIYTDRVSTSLNGVRFLRDTRYQTVYEGLTIESFKGTGMYIMDMCWSMQASLAPLIRFCGIGLIVENNSNAVTLAGIGLDDNDTYNCILRGVVSATFVGGYNQFAGTAGVLIEDGTLDTEQDPWAISFLGTYFEGNGANHIHGIDGRGLIVQGCHMNCNGMTAAAIRLENWRGARIHGNTPANLSSGTQRDFVEADANCTLIDVGYQHVATQNDVFVCVQGGSTAGLINGAAKRFAALPTPNVLSLGTTSLRLGSGDDANRAVPWMVVQPTTATFEYRRLELSPIKLAAQTVTSPYTPNINTHGVFDITVPNTGLTIEAPTGEKADGDRLVFMFRQNSTGGGALTWNAAYATNLSNTGNTANTYASVSFRWSAGRSRWVQTGKLEWVA